MRKFRDWLKNEIISLTPIWIFFLFSFSLLKLTENTILYEFGLKIEGYHRVIIGTFLISKVFILLDNVKLMNLYNSRPLIFNILWKTLFYSIGTLIIRYFDLLWGAPEFTARLKINEPRFWLIQVWLLVLVFIFCSTRELIQKMGQDKFKKMVFG